MPIIDENTKYKFLKLVNGKEMFAMVKEMPMHNQFELHFPMNVSLSAAATGGVLVNLGPTKPFSKEDHITIDKDSILFMNELDDKFVNLYDEACTSWLSIKDDEKVEIKGAQQVYKEEREMLEKMLKKRFSKEFRDFEDERLLEDMIEDEYFNSSSEGPNEDDIIH